MKIHIITPWLPPKLNGIGDHTALFASAIANRTTVTIITSHQMERNPLPGLAIKPVFDGTQPRSISRIAEIIEQDKPDWVLLQFEQFMYGPLWGFNPWLPFTISQIKRKCPCVRFALMAHETFVPSSTWQKSIMASWQRLQYASLVHSADIVFITTEAWRSWLQEHFPRKRVVHLPVGSNIPRVPITHDAARERLGVDLNTFVVGLFGSPATNLEALARVRDALQAVQAKEQNVLLLYMGSQGKAVQTAMGNLPIRTDGPLTAEEVSRRFAALDAYLVPIEEGVTTRRGTLMTGLQHGVATVTTCGSITEAVIMSANGKALLITPFSAQQEFTDNLVRIAEDEELRRQLQCGAQTLYESEFSWTHIAAQFLNAVGAS